MARSLSVSKTDTTQQAGDHAAHHNALALYSIADDARIAVLETKFSGRLAAYGTSRSAGGVPRALITGPKQLAERFPSKLASMLGLTEVMYATSGSTPSQDDSSPLNSGGGWSHLFHRIRRLKPNEHQQGVGATGGPMNLNHPDAVVTIADWINDMAQANAVSQGPPVYTGNRQAARTANIIRMAMRNLISLSQASRIWEPNHTTTGELVYSGTTSTHVAVSYSTGRVHPHDGAVSGPAGYRSMPSGSIVDIPLPADYPGSAVAPVSVVFSGVVATTAGTVVSSGTGVPSKTLTLDGGTWADPDSTNPLIMRFTGSDLAAGAKVIRLTVTTTGANARFQRAWIESDTPPEVLAFETVITMPAPSLFPQLGTSDFDFYNAILEAVCAEFRSNVHYVTVPKLDSRGVLNTALHPYFTDSMHYTELGMAEYAAAGYQALAGAPDGDSIPAVVRTWARRARASVLDFHCELGLASTVTVANNTLVFIPWDIEYSDTFGAHDDVSNTTRLYAPANGLYRLEFAGGFDEGAPGVGVRYLYFQKTMNDGSTELGPVQNIPTVGTDGIFKPSGQTVWTTGMRAGEYVECAVLQSSGTSRTFQATGPLAKVTFMKVAEI